MKNYDLAFFLKKDDFKKKLELPVANDQLENVIYFGLLTNQMQYVDVAVKKSPMVLLVEGARVLNYLLESNISLKDYQRWFCELLNKLCENAFNNSVGIQKKNENCEYLLSEVIKSKNLNAFLALYSLLNQEKYWVAFGFSKALDLGLTVLSIALLQNNWGIVKGFIDLASHECIGVESVFPVLLAKWFEEKVEITSFIEILEKLEINRKKIVQEEHSVWLDKFKQTNYDQKSLESEQLWGGLKGWSFYHIERQYDKLNQLHQLIIESEIIEAIDPLLILWYHHFRMIRLGTKAEISNWLLKERDVKQKVISDCEQKILKLINKKQDFGNNMLNLWEKHAL